MKKFHLLLIIIYLAVILVLTACNPPNISLKPIEDIANGFSSGLANFGDNISHMFDNFTSRLPVPK